MASGKITTTKARVKAIQGQVDKYVSRAKKATPAGGQGGVAIRRKILAEMGNDRETVDALFTKVAKTMAQRKSGFTKTTLLPRRKGDNAEMARLEWVEEKKEEKKNENVSTKTKRD